MKHLALAFGLLAMLTPFLLKADSVVVFNEIMYHPATNEPALEWIEFYNQNAVDVDLSGWRVANGIDYTSPNGTVIRGGGYLVLAISPSALNAQSGLTNIFGPFSGRLSNSGETLELRDNNNRLMDLVKYGADGDWPVGPDGAGPSLVKINPNLASRPAANWTASSQIGGSPGAINFSTVLRTGAKTNLVNITNFWRFNDTGTDLGVSWRASGYDDSAWAAGPALFFIENAALPALKNTPLAPGPSTYYFRTTFNFSGDSSLKLLSFRPVVDDGAILYLNGLEIYRFNMPTGVVNYSTMAASAIGHAAFSGPFSIPSSNLVVGQNVLAVELHQSAAATNAGLRVIAAAGYVASWDGDDGDFSTPANPARAPANAALGTNGVDVFTSSNTNLASALNDGLYGSSSSWGPAAGDANLYAILRFNQTIPISSIAWSRDNGNTNEAACGGTCTDRSIGNYTFQYTLATNPAVVVANSSNPSNGWATIATVQYLSAQPGFTPSLRHRFDFGTSAGTPLLATGVRIRVGLLTTFDEIEINPPAAAAVDAAFGMELTSTDILPPPPKLAFNEISGAGTNTFWLELINYGAGNIDLAGVQVVRSGSSSGTYTFSSQLLPAGGIVSLTQAQLGFGAPDASKLFLYTPGQFALLDAVTVKTGPRARAPDGVGSWMSPAAITPGASNSVSLRSDIVFNEVMYHHRPFDPVPAVTSNFTLVPITGTWRYNDSGADLGSIWRVPGYVDTGWLSGPALMSVNTASLPLPASTTLAPGRSTYYFRTTFSFSGSTNNIALNLRTILDDGAVFYLNGVEIYRQNMPGGPVTYGTSAAGSVGDAGYTGPLTLVASNLVQGVNVLAVEVHQLTPATTSSGLTLSGGGLTLVEEGPFGGTAPMNLARQPGSAPFVIDSLAGYPIHDYLHLDDGVYGNPNSWIGNSGNPGYAGIRFDDVYSISSFAFGRDNLGTYADRTLGLYTLQYTRVASPGTGTAFTGNPDTGWATIGTLNYQNAGTGLFANPSRRHRYTFDPVLASGVRLLVPGTGLSVGTDIDELEINPPNTSGDIAFAAELVLTTTLSPAAPFTKSGEEWIELYNRGTNLVDLAGWDLDQAIHFHFSAGTTVEPGGYLVVANDVATMRSKWPEVSARILGNFTGKIGANEALTLKDASGNVVNSIRIYDTGWSDGGGSSLELVDPRADNSNLDAWADSDETSRSSWQTVTYRMISGQRFGPTLWNEFRLALLDAGEILVDDVSVVRDPDGARQQLMQNGNFETTTGNTHWRMLGDHGDSRIIQDPDNGGNHVLKVAASSPPRTSHNHIESSFIANTPLIDGQEYEVSYRARWRAGSPQVGTTAYFQRLARTTILNLPARHGTPAAVNSRRLANAGPTFTGLKHFPVTPQTNETVTISVRASDPDGVVSAVLNYRVNPATTFIPVPMNVQSDGTWSGAIPPQGAGKIVQFYVTAQDSLGASSFAPVLGPNSRALYQVADTQGTQLAAHELRLIQLDADRDFMLNTTNVMSQALLGGTVIYDRSEVFYDAGARLHGSAAGRARDGDSYISYTIAFPPDHLFRGFLGEVNIDRSGRAPTVRQQDEIYVLHMFHRAGVACHNNDFCYFIAPKPLHTGTAILQLGAYNGTFVDEQYNVDGPVYNFDITYEPSTTVDGTFESLKLPVPLQGHIGTDFTDLGNDKEQYRSPFDMRHGTRADDFSGLIRLCQTMGLPQPDFDAKIGTVLDVDEAMRVAGIVMLCGIGDIYYAGGLPHNLRLYTPSDGGLAHFLPWDMDFVFTSGSSSSIYPSGNNFAKLMNNATTQRRYLSHINDLCQTVFNTDYMNPWLAHYGAVVGQNYTGASSYISSRRTYALSQLPAVVPFAITSNGGRDFMTNTPMVTINGTGWLDIWQIRLPGNTNALSVTWTSWTNWSATLPLLIGTNQLTFVAFDRTNNMLASKSITVTTTAANGGVDTDGDGMPDAWETANGLNPFVNDAAQDKDGDGVSNLQEYLTGTNPSDALSFIRISATSDSGNVRLTFFAAAGRAYSVFQSDQPKGSGWDKLADAPAQSTNRIVTLLVPQPLPAPQRFYKLAANSSP